MKEELLGKIKSKGYWRINFRPITVNSKESLSKCEELVRKNSVKLRGWDYPHIQDGNEDNGAILRSSEYVEGWVDWSYFKEFWRMYKSTQFLSYLALRIDWMEEGEWIFGKPDKIPEPGKELGVVDTTYQLTEIFEFLSRLIQSGIYKEGVEVNIRLINLDNRNLIVDGASRVPFMFKRVTGAEQYSFSKIFNPKEILEDPKGHAREVIQEIFEIFGWDDPPIDTIKKDQEDLLLRRF